MHCRRLYTEKNDEEVFLGLRADIFSSEVASFNGSLEVEWCLHPGSYQCEGDNHAVKKCLFDKPGTSSACPITVRSFFCGACAMSNCQLGMRGRQQPASSSMTALHALEADGTELPSLPVIPTLQELSNMDMILDEDVDIEERFVVHRDIVFSVLLFGPNGKLLPANPRLTASPLLRWAKMPTICIASVIRCSGAAPASTPTLMHAMPLLSCSW